MTENLKVGLLGFSEKNAEKLEQIFQATRNRERSYSVEKLSNHNDLVIVDIDDQSFFDRKNHIDSIDLNIPVVTLGKAETPQGSEYHIKGMLLATRVIRVLDLIKFPATNKQDFIGCEQTTEVVTDADGIETTTYAYSVLVVDDSELMRKAIALELKKASLPLSVDFAETGEQALDKVAGTNYDFIFLDVMMPGIDGYETCGRIRKISTMKKTPIIMLSSKNSPMDEVKGIMAGSTNYLSKPIVPNEFQKMLDRIMNWLSNYKH
jgi:twitching motility two-component system response regulator PilG